MPEHLLAVALLSAVGTWLARSYALRRSLIDQPGERRSHVRATPRGGGIGPVVALLAALLFADVLAVDARVPAAAGLALVAGIGWWDDHRPLSASVRLAVHLAAGALLATAFGLWDSVWLALATVLGTAALINVWNFMDGIDGIATLQAAVFATAAAMLPGAAATSLAWAAAAACVAFLPFNFPRARIFLGDVGSGALGYVAALLVASRLPDEARVLALAFPLAPFLVDAGLTLARRVVRGERWWTAHTQHLYQAAARRLGHPPVALAYTVLALLGAVVAWRVEPQGVPVMMVSLAVWYTACAVSWAVLQHVAAGRGAPTEMDR